jgi:hypothetical protein
MFVTAGQGQKKKRAPPPPPGVGVTKDDQQQRHSSSLSLSSTDQKTTESFNKTTSLERHMSGKNSVVASGQSPDKSSTLPGKMKMSHNYRPVETTVQTSADTPEIEKQPPEEMCLDEDEKISEVERASVPDVPEETSPIHSETHEDELINATKNQSSDRDTSKTQDKCFQQSPVPPVETAPVPPVELASRSKCPQTVDTSTPQGKLVAGELEIGTDYLSWKDTWNMGVVTPTFECKARHSSSFSSETLPPTPRSSLQLRTLSSVHRRASDCTIKDYCPEVYTSNRKVLSDVHDHKKVTPHSKHNSITGQKIQSAVTDGGASRKLPYCNAKQYLCSMNHHAKLSKNLYDTGNRPTLSSCNKITACSSLNSKQKLVNPDSQNFQTLVRRSSNISAQENSNSMATSPEKHKHGAGNHNYSSPENIICVSKLHKTGSRPVLEQVNCSSVVQQGQCTQNNNCEIINPEKVSTLCKLGSSMYSSPTVSKWECDVNTGDKQVTPEMRVSLLVPPPADFMVSRSESNQSWKKFLQELDKILENRAEIV